MDLAAMESATRKPKGGRIAMVLKEARASLKEPSRPHTPASLDARTAMSLDGARSRANSHDSKRNKRGERGPAGTKSTKNQQPDIWVNENIDNSDDSHGDGYSQPSSLGKSKVSMNSARVVMPNPPLSAFAPSPRQLQQLTANKE